MSSRLRFWPPVSLLTGFVQSVLPCAPRPSTAISGFSQASRRWKNRGYRRNQVTIGMLPDDVLVEIFVFYVDVLDMTMTSSEWHTLVH
ncbi:hypothetical protein F5148DRAFT_1370272, partial [Russula earlei]